MVKSCSVFQKTIDVSNSPKIHTPKNGLNVHIGSEDTHTTTVFSIKHDFVDKALKELIQLGKKSRNIRCILLN